MKGDIGVVIEIRRARSDRNAAKFYGYPYFTFYLEEFFALISLCMNVGVSFSKP